MEAHVNKSCGYVAPRDRVSAEILLQRLLGDHVLSNQVQEMSEGCLRVTEKLGEVQLGASAPIF
ncbi:MAG: hypothetical protein ACFCU5_16655 [Pleurocapsa sp.]